jgi:hypothetical protein
VPASPVPASATNSPTSSAAPQCTPASPPLLHASPVHASATGSPVSARLARSRLRQRPLLGHQVSAASPSASRASAGAPLLRQRPPHGTDRRPRACATASAIPATSR